MYIYGDILYNYNHRPFLQYPEKIAHSLLEYRKTACAYAWRKLKSCVCVFKTYRIEAAHVIIMIITITINAKWQPECYNGEKMTHPVGHIASTQNISYSRTCTAAVAHFARIVAET